MKKQILYIIGCSALLSSCHIYSNYERPENIVSDSLYRDTTAAYAVLASDTANFGNMPWQEVFSEPQLQALINKARRSDYPAGRGRFESFAFGLPARVEFRASGNRQQLRRCQSHSDLFTSRSGKLANRRFWLSSQPEETI